MVKTGEHSAHMCHKMNDNMVFACNTSVSLFREVTEIDFLVELIVALAVKEHWETLRNSTGNGLHLRRVLTFTLHL